MNYNFAYSASPRLAPVFEQRLERVNLPETDAGGIVAPWWEGVVIERAASSDGGPLPKAFFEEYSKLIAIFDALIEDETVEPGAVAMARQMLWRAMFAGAVAPRVSWHRESVVLFWTAGAKTSFFTIEAQSFSYLQECDGEITERVDDFPPRIWDTIFPLVHGVH